jgi:ketosteroid isomerase-like protein
MSQENVEIVRHFIGLWNAGDLDGFADLWDSNAVFRAVEGWPEPGPWCGRDAIMGQWRRMREDFGEQTVVIEKITAHTDWVLVRQTWRARGDRSGIETELSNSAALRLRGGKVVEIRFYWDHAEALKAVGLAE